MKKVYHVYQDKYMDDGEGSLSRLLPKFLGIFESFDDAKKVAETTPVSLIKALFWSRKESVHVIEYELNTSNFKEVFVFDVQTQATQGYSLEELEDEPDYEWMSDVARGR